MSIEVGDILCVKPGKGFISRGIGWAMSIYKKKNNITGSIYSHNARVVDIWGELWISEANQKGVQTQLPLKAYSEKDWKERIDVLTPIVPYTEEEKKAISKNTVNYSLVITHYWFLNLLWHLIKLFFGVWIGRKEIKNRVYCSELIAIVENTIRKDTFKDPVITNPIDVSFNSSFKFKENYLDNNFPFTSLHKNLVIGSV